MSKLALIVQAGPHGRCDTPLRVKLAEALKGATEARLADADTGRLIPCQIDGEDLVAIMPGLGAHEERRLTLEVGAEGYRHGGVVLTDLAAHGLSVDINGKALTTYRYLPEGEYPTKARPFFYPVYGAGGLPMTRNFPMRDDVEGEKHDHPHHRGLWVAFGEVNGTDNWSEGKAHAYQIHKGFAEITGGPVFGRFVEDLHWESKDHEKVCEERRTVTFWNVSVDGRILDLTVTFKATDGPIEFGDTKEGGICSIRVPTTMDGAAAGLIENSAGGVGERETWGKPAHWVDYHGPSQGQHVGVAIMDHPLNLRHPTPWHVRDYGLFGANPFGHSYYKSSHLTNGAYTVAAGEELTFRYRVYFHRGDPRRGDVAGKWHDYAFPPVVKVAE